MLGEARAAGRLSEYLGKAEPAELVAGANRFGPPQGDPAIVPALKDDQVLGFVYLNSDFANATGYSGKPIQMLVGITPKGMVTGLKMVEHKEPIVLLGIPEKRMVDAVNKLIGADMDSVARGTAPAPQVDIVSGATVTVLVMGDSIVRSATKLIKSGRLGGQGNVAAVAAPQVKKTIDPGKGEVRDWQTLVGDGSVLRRLILSVDDVNKAFEKSGNAAAAARPEEGDPDDTFIDLYVADVAVPTIGRSLLGDDGFNRLAGRLKPGQQALVVAGSGRYSFKGAAYVRGGIFDRIELIQDNNSIRFRDRDHTRLGSLDSRRRAATFPRSRCSCCRRNSPSIRPSPGCCNCWSSAWSAPRTRPGSPSISATRCRTATSSASRQHPRSSRQPNPPRLPRRRRQRLPPCRPTTATASPPKTNRCG